MGDAASFAPASFAAGRFDIHHYATIGSTNDEARHLAGRGCPDGTVVWSDEQTKGRGRYGRKWQSPRGNLSFSVVLRPALAAARTTELGFVAAVVTAECVASLLPAGSGRVGLKWPNDVRVDGAKIAGLLPEAETADGRLIWVVLGIGINVAQPPRDTPYPATALNDHGAGATPEQTLRAYLAHLAHWLDRWQRDGFAAIRAAWLARAEGLGGEVVVKLGEHEQRGVFADMDADGAMILATAGGTRRITAGDVAFGIA